MVLSRSGTEREERGRREGGNDKGSPPASNTPLQYYIANSATSRLALGRDWMEEGRGAMAATGLSFSSAGQFYLCALSYLGACVSARAVFGAVSVDYVALVSQKHRCSRTKGTRHMSCRREVEPYSAMYTVNLERTAT